ncbi:MAG TPA: SGNH/GDSL hydrolase family protein [Candidatus Polarisedimenticolaceae bacterium]|nr:SGNH/GDSL hydrolase family protein [Candidatus Polarisedimenticolaceae bacterium]
MTGVRRAFFYLAMFALVGVLALTMVELLARVADPVGISYYPETARYMDTLVREEALGYRNRPGLTGTFYGAPVRINALGMRDRELSPDPSPGEFRVAIVGDSFPFGIGVDYEHSIPAVVERVLNESAPEGTRFTTLNFGVPSYNTEQELLQFRTLGERLHPRAVVLLFALNDIYPKNWVFEKRSGIVKDLAQRSYAVSLVFALYRLSKAAHADPRNVAGLEMYEPDHPRWLAIERSLVALHTRCRELSIPFVVLPSDALELKSLSMVKELGAKDGFPVVNLVPGNDARWKALDPHAYMNSRVDSHPNAAGCEIYGRLIAEQLQQLGAVPFAPRSR